MRLFIAIDIDENVRWAVGDLQKEIKSRMKNGKGLKWVEPENMHLTIKFLGETDENKIGDIAAAVEIACNGKKSFKFDLSQVGTFGRPAKVLWLGCENQSEELVRLAADIDQILQGLGFEKETRPFSAHLTLGRIKDSGVDKNLYRILNDYRRVNIPPILVDSVCLYKSQLTEVGPLYTLLRKIELKKDI